MDAATVTALCAGIVTILTTLGTLIATLKGNKQINVVQESVNGNLTREQSRNAQLQAAMVANDVAIPAIPPPVVVALEPDAA